MTAVIRSRYGDITTGKQAKHGFADIKTLHALITDPADLSGAERAVWQTLPRIFAARGGRSRHVAGVLVCETMRLMEGRYQEAVGVWEPAEGWIIVKRSQLQSLADFAGTVLHELSHALRGAPDMSLEFEQQLTRELGGIVARNITNV